MTITIPASITTAVLALNETRLRRRLDENRSKHMAGWTPDNYFTDHNLADDAPTGTRRLI